MPFPTIAGVGSSSRPTIATTHNLNMPSGVSLPGDLLIMAVRVTVPGTIGWPAGWTELFQDSSDGSDDVTALAYHFADVGEPSGIDVTHGNGRCAAICWRVLDAAIATPPQVSSLATGNSSAPNPPSFTPPGGSQEYVWIALAGSEGAQSALPAYPSSYGLNRITVGTGVGGAVTTNCRLYAAARLLSAASDDPTNFTISAADDWTACVVVVAPRSVLEIQPAPIVLATSVPSPTIELLAPMFEPGAPGAQNLISRAREAFAATPRPPAFPGQPRDAASVARIREGFAAPPRPIPFKGAPRPPPFKGN